MSANAHSDFRDATIVGARVIGVSRSRELASRRDDAQIRLMPALDETPAPPA
jgi:hypothetical protein